jgi:hypothetical protein
MQSFIKGKKVKNTSNKIRHFITVVFVLLVCGTIRAEEYMLSDVIAAQEQASSGVESMTGEIETLVDFNGQTQAASYDYSMAIDENGNKKMMVKTKGIFTMQFLVDTSDMSVTYLMADGSRKKVTITAETREEIMNMAGIGGLGSGSVFAAINNGKNKTDGVYLKGLDKSEYEDGRVRVKVRKKKELFGGDFGEVEFYDKKAANIGINLDERIAQAELGKATRDGAKKMKKRFIDEMKKNRNRVIGTTIVKRTEKINMATGITEETQFFNGEGGKIGEMKVRKKERLK